VLNTYVCDEYLCFCWLFMSVMISVMYIYDIYVISSVCVDGIQKTNKKVYTGHFCRVLHSAKSTDLDTGLGSLPSVMSLALGKEVVFAECHLRHSTKNLTWGPSLAVSLPSVSCDTRQRSILYRVLPGRHSAKQTSLPSVTRDTRQSNRLRHPAP
jgi:hypothetical protein